MAGKVEGLTCPRCGSPLTIMGTCSNPECDYVYCECDFCPYQAEYGYDNPYCDSCQEELEEYEDEDEEILLDPELAETYEEIGDTDF